MLQICYYIVIVKYKTFKALFNLNSYYFNKKKWTEIDNKNKQNYKNNYKKKRV